MSVAAMRSLGADGHAKSADDRFCQGALRLTHNSNPSCGLSPGIAPSLVLGLFAWCHRSRSLCSIMLGPSHVFRVVVVDNELVQVLIQS